MKTENTVEKRMHSWIPVLQRKDVKARITLQTYSYFRYFHLFTRCKWKILSGIVVYLNFDLYIVINLILPKQIRGNASNLQNTRLSRFYCQYRPAPLSKNRSTVNTQISILYDYCPRNYARESFHSLVLVLMLASLRRTCKPGRRKHKHKRKHKALMLASHRFTRRFLVLMLVLMLMLASYV